MMETNSNQLKLGELMKATVSMADFARLIGKSPQTIYQWCEHLDMPRRPDGLLNLHQAMFWFTQYFENLKMPALKFGEVSQEQLASLLGYSRQTVWQWVKDDNCPQNQNGTFDIRVVLKWLGPHYKREAEKIFKET